MRFGIDLGRCNPALWRDLAQAADALGYESLWLPEHLVLPAAINEAPAEDVHGRIDPEMPVFDAFAMLGALAAVTSSIRVGTNVYNIGLRHPFSTARGVATVDVISNGRFDLGIGASWLRAEWDAAGLDFATRGARVDEAISICRRLWTESVVEHHGAHFTFGPVAFEPKPVQSSVPIHIGGDSARALRRVVEHGDGWIGMIHDSTTFAASVSSLKGACDAAGRDIDTIQRSALVARPDNAAIAAWAAAGATRLIVAPWQRSRDAIDGLLEFARHHDVRGFKEAAT